MIETSPMGGVFKYKFLMNGNNKNEKISQKY